MKILLVEDDPRVAEVLVTALNSQLYIVDVAMDGETAWEQVQIFEYDLLLLDVSLPSLDGVSLCRRLRSNGYNMPIIMNTARNSSNDKVTALDAGADDYIVKPIDLSELLARLRALLRRGRASGSPVLEWGHLQLDPSTYEVNYENQPLRLTAKEFSLLKLFLSNGKRVLTRSAIVEHLWDLENPPQEETVKAHVKSLRQKLKAVGAPHDLIETVHSVGYRLKYKNLGDSVPTTGIAENGHGSTTLTANAKVPFM